MLFGNLTYEASVLLRAKPVKIQERKPYTKISYEHKVFKFSNKILVDQIQKCINRISPSKPKDESSNGWLARHLQMIVIIQQTKGEYTLTLRKAEKTFVKAPQSFILKLRILVI